MKIIGITGGVGAGKSELLAYIKKHYACEIYLADEVAHLVKSKKVAPVVIRRKIHTMTIVLCHLIQACLYQLVKG